MKSKLFSEELIPGEDFKKDVSGFLQLSKEQLKSLADWVSSLNQGATFDNKVVREKSEELGIKEETFVESLKISIFLITAAGRHNDSFDNIIDDMVSQNLVPEERRSDLLLFFTKVTEKASEFSDLQKRTAAKIASIPFLQAEEHIVNLRLVLKEKFNLEDEIEKYTPKGLTLLPIALVKLTINDGVKDSPFSFQIDFEGLERLILAFQACQKEMRLMESIAQKIDITSI